MTSRLRLRQWCDADLEPYAALNADPRVREFFPSRQTYQESAGSMQFIRDHWQRRSFGLWAVEVIDGTDRPMIGLTETQKQMYERAKRELMWKNSGIAQIRA